MASIFSGKGGRNAANWGQMVMDDSFKYAKGALEQGQKGALDAYGRAENLYKPVAADYQPFSSMFKNAVGLGGSGGTASALSAFRGANPGYQFAYDQGMQGLNRAASAGGRLASGNAMMEAQKYGTGLADQTYNSWLSRLGEGQDRAFRGIQGQSQAIDAQGRTYMQGGQDMAGLQMDMGKTSAGIGMSGMKAGDQAAANRFGALMGGLNMLSSLGGSIFGGFGKTA